jgi:peroxiredoxin
MSYDPPNFVREYVKTNRLPFMVALDSDGGLARAFGEIQLTPTSILIDKEGRIVKRYLGVPNFTELNQLIEEKLKA